MKQSTGLLIAAGVTVIVMACAGAAVVGFVAVKSVDGAVAAQKQPPADPTAPQPTGPVIELEQGTVAPTQSQSAQPTPQTTRLSADEAVAIATRLARGATLQEPPTLVTLRRNIQAFEVKLDVGTLYIDANTGRLLGVTRPQNPPATPGSRGGRDPQNQTSVFVSDLHEEDDDD